MRELERHPHPPSAHPTSRPQRVAIVGRGRVGTALAAAFRAAGIAVTGPLGRGAPARGPNADADAEAAHDADAVLLCVPDAEIASAAAAVEIGPPVGHCSGATGLDVLVPHAAFSLHPLMTFAGVGEPPRLAGAGAAIAGTTPQTLALAHALADTLGLHPIEVAAEDRVAYHAAASIASNFLITLEAAAERLAATAGLERQLLVPLVRATVENWAQLGAERVLTGPVARGDEETIERQRSAVAQRTPQLLDLFDTLVLATRALAHPPRVSA
jgi:predicted short-subunit dehydrogenase-like oxidoreductase (DUF2520 family)